MVKYSLLDHEIGAEYRYNKNIKQQKKNIRKIIELDILNQELKDKELINSILLIIELLKTIESNKAIINIKNFNNILNLIKKEKKYGLEINGFNYSLCSTYVHELRIYKDFYSNNIFNLKNLMVLNLENRGINYLPKEIGNLINLKFLNLKTNLLKKIPNTIKNCKKLRYIYLNNNKIKILNYGLLIPSLISINISNNKNIIINEKYLKKIIHNDNIKLIYKNNFKNYCYEYLINT